MSSFTRNASIAAVMALGIGAVGLDTVCPGAAAAATTTVTSGTVTVRTIYSPTNIRTAATTSSKAATQVRAGVTITGTLSHGWVHITSPSNLAGKYVGYSVVRYISSPSSTSSTPPSGGKAVVSHGGGVTGTTSPVTPVYKLNTTFNCSANPTLSEGSTGDCVKAVQNTLNSWIIRTNANGGQLMTSSTGNFGDQTKANIELFQRTNGIPASGTIDAATWKALAAASQSVSGTGTTNISGAPGDTHPAFPSAIRLQDGRLMIVFTSAQMHRDNTSPSTTWKTYSSDGGYSWSTPQQITLPNGLENTPAALGIATSGPLKGHPILTTWSVRHQAGNKDFFETEVTISADLEGDNWGPLTDIYDQGNSYSASPIVQVDDTNFQQAVYVNAGKPNSSARTVGLTYDGQKFVVGTMSVIAAVADGATPTSTSTVNNTTGTGSTAPGTATPNPVSTTMSNAVRGTNGSFSEVGMVKLNDGRLFALVRNDTSGVALPGSSAVPQPGIWGSYSSDGGKTWTLATRLFDGSGAPRVTLTSDGKLVVLYRHTTSNNQAAGNKDAVYRVSTDNGRTWANEQAAGAHSPFEMAYGTPVPNADGTVTFVYASETSGGTPATKNSPEVKGVSHMVTTPNVTVKK